MKNELTDEELSKLINLAKRVLWSPPEVRRKLQDQLIKETRTYLEQAHSELKDYISKSDFELKEVADKAIESRNMDDAIRYLEQIENKNPEELNKLGILYFTDRKDNELAKEYLLKAAEKEHPSAMFNLAVLYQREFKDFKEAERYYLLAVEREFPYAIFNLANL